MSLGDCDELHDGSFTICNLPFGNNLMSCADNFLSKSKNKN